jgi:predicted nucleic acid-binding Zn finger protein
MKIGWTVLKRFGKCYHGSAGAPINISKKSTEFSNFFYIGTGNSYIWTYIYTQTYSASTPLLDTTLFIFFFYIGTENSYIWTYIYTQTYSASKPLLDTTQFILKGEDVTSITRYVRN